MPPELVTGWDVGGAHLKVAQCDASGRVHRVRQLPCPLWQGLHHLEQALATLHDVLAPTPRHALTMTGELADFFSDRAEGVAQLVATMHRAFPAAGFHVYAGSADFVAPDAAVQRSAEVASANWHATARWLAQRHHDGLLVDVGSTTTDLVPYAAGEVRALGYSDAERLAAAELVYTGVTRTPVASLASSAPFAGHVQPLMPEHFATAADVHRLTGALAADADQHPTADGRGKDAIASARRLARMLGHDYPSASLEQWRAVARYLSERQLQQLYEAACRVLSREIVATGAPLVGAGVGRFLVPALAQRLNRPCVDFASLVEGEAESYEWAARCAPAVAVAALLAAV
jgi:(4-(4-[2-(gamma-L-glutamylamino)ethyl]phenoxymethyl)furan-2-yl)methanamine synthase